MEYLDEYDFELNRLKSHESPRASGRNDKSGAASARLRQLQKRQQALRRKLK